MQCRGKYFSFTKLQHQVFGILTYYYFISFIVIVTLKNIMLLLYKINAVVLLNIKRKMYVTFSKTMGHILERGLTIITLTSGIISNFNKYFI